jgi:hypothetical protein
MNVIGILMGIGIFQISSYFYAWVGLDQDTPELLE